VDPITISDGSGGSGSSRDIRPTDKEAQTSHIVRRTSWPAGLRSIEEQRKKEEEEREQEARQQLQEEQQPLPMREVVGQLPAGPQLEVPQEPQQRQQRGRPLEEPLEPPPHSPPQPVLPAP